MTIVKHSTSVIDAESVVFHPQSNPDAAYQLLQDISHDAGLVKSSPVEVRKLCERALSHIDHAVRDGAIVALAGLDDADAIPALVAARRREPVTELRADIEHVLAQLRAKK